MDVRSNLDNLLSTLNNNNSDAKIAKQDFFNERFIVVETINNILFDIEQAVPGNTSDDYKKEMTNVDLFKSFNYKSIQFFIRLFPKAAQLAYPNSKLATGTVSDNRILSINNGYTNLECNLTGNLALNTLDAQWLDMYANIFDFMTSLNLREGFTFKFGNYSIPNCYFKKAPRMINNGLPANMFNLELISSVRSLKNINVNTYYSSGVSGE